MNFKNTSKHKLIVVCLSCIMMFSMTSCGQKEATIVSGSSILPMPTKKTEEVTVPSNTNEVKFTGVLTYINTDDNQMHYVDIDTGSEYEVSYTGGTDIQDKYGQILAASGMKIGAIYDVTCSRTSKAKSIYGSNDTWEINGLTNFECDDNDKKITVGNKNYKYETYSAVLSNGNRISMSQIVKQDEVTIRGKDSVIYSVTVDKGHGYIKFTGIDTFLDGYATIGRSQLLSVTSNMMVTAQEGTYSVELQKGSIIGAKTVTVERDQQVAVDFTEYTSEAEKMGAVNFMVTPENAVMTIDGAEVDYSQPISLPYGTHTVALMANHYTTYAENIVVDTDYQTKVIDMVATSTSTTTSATTKASTETATTKATTATKSTTTSTTVASNLTEGYTVSITEPKGASLYVDSEYIGVIPCSFDKKAGNRTITLSQNGYATVSYSISIANATGNLTYSFPDMVERNASQSQEDTATTAANETRAEQTRAEQTRAEQTRAEQTTTSN